MVKSHVLELEKQGTPAATGLQGVTGSLAILGGGPPPDLPERTAGCDKEAHQKPTLLPLDKFMGDEEEAGAFEQWTRKLLLHDEIEKWSDHIKLLQLELHLSGREEQVYEMLSEEEHLPRSY